ncbi:hypothetical protein BDR04DRAFT_1107854 [Suillus decipiens]|nr:hypothetical protein BDR04DRAFT_1107854 [Suillus decipiens]
MRFSILTAVVALTASMYVSACRHKGAACNQNYPDVCCSSICGSNDVSMSRLLRNQDSTT